MTWDGGIEKNTILLNGAGQDEYNPILEGLSFLVVVEFSEEVHGIMGLVGPDSPPKTAIGFTQDNENSRRWYYSAVAGQAPFNTVSADTFVRILFSSSLTGNQTIWNKKVYVAALPLDTVQVYDAENGWTSVNYTATPGTIPRCAQLCPVRILNSWHDNFRLKCFGGARYVSIFDYGTDEDDTDRLDVKREINLEIAQVHYLYLEKHEVGQVENHDITVRFKTKSGIDSTSVDVRIKLESLSCWGFEIKDPVTDN